MDNMREELLPCPFCGFQDMLVVATPEDNPAHESWVSCRGCDASSKMMCRSADKTAAQNAIKAWNTRTPPISYEASLKWLRVCLEEFPGEKPTQVRAALNYIKQTLAAMGISEGA